MVGEIFVDPWRYQLHLEVWLLTAFLIGSYIYVVRVLGPHTGIHIKMEVKTRSTCTK